MKKKRELEKVNVVFSFNDSQCERVFCALSLRKKQRILYAAGLDGSDVKVGSFLDPALLKDILCILNLYVTIETWGRLKQVCTVFNLTLKLPGPILRIQSVPGKVWLSERRTIFWQWLARYMMLTGTTFRNGYTIDWVKHAVMNAKDRRRYIPLDDGTDVRYPEGLIRMQGSMRCTIFDREVVQLFTYESAVQDKRHPRTVVQYSQEMRRLHQATQKRWIALRIRETHK